MCSYFMYVVLVVIHCYELIVHSCWLSKADMAGITSLHCISSRSYERCYSLLCKTGMTTRCFTLLSTFNLLVLGPTSSILSSSFLSFHLLHSSLSIFLSFHLPLFPSSRSSELVFTPHYFIIFAEFRPSGTPYVLQLWFGLDKGVLHIKAFTQGKTTIPVLVKFYEVSRTVTWLK